MKVSKRGLKVKVTARVVHRSLRGRDTGGKTEAFQIASILFLRLIEVDGRKANNTRAYIYYNQQVARLHLAEGNLITFEGYARSGKNGYHFIYLRNIRILREEPIIVAIIHPGQKLVDYVNQLRSQG